MEGGTQGTGSVLCTTLVDWMLEASRNRMKAWFPVNCTGPKPCAQRARATYETYCAGEPDRQ